MFADSGQQLGALQTSSVMLSDVDGDDDLDLIVGNFGVVGSEWLNDGNGNFTDTGRSIGNGNSSYNVSSVALGDLDGDYDLDIVLGELGANQVWWNSLRTPPRNHIFIDSGQLLGNTYTTAVALGDVDGDGDLDMVEGNGLGEAGKVWLYNGTGGFTDSGQALGISASSMVLGDVDGDGDLDIVEGNTNNLPDQVWLNNGAGVFTDSGQLLGAVSTSSVALADVDGDGDLDMLAGSYSQGVHVWRNNGSGIFTDSGQALGALSGAIVTGDIDGDGDVDFVVADAASTVWLNNGTGTFSSGQVLASTTTVTFALGDIDNDGDLDLFVGREENSTQVWVNNGSGTFADSGQILGTNFLGDAISSNSLVLGDVDADGDLDLVQDNSNTEPNRVWINDGRGRFGSGQALGTSSSIIAIGDIDDDGDPDLVDANNGANQVWLNDY
ncbi:MAG: VCBS repeat-containing protein [Gammaproteobacteria bacterium]|nr:VCBS repeat-containing protein [Gammaproteobacteria bacterium]